MNEGFIHILRFNSAEDVLVDQPKPSEKGDSYVDVVEDVLGIKEWFDPETERLMAEFRELRDGGGAREWLLDDLRGMNQDHCSFCDAFPIESQSTEPIEHFRPKSRPEFYGLAYSWDNLFYCCDLCQSQKGEEWDVRLLKPDAVDYEFSDYFQFRDGHIVPAESADDDGQARARATIRLYGFNENSRPRYRLLELRKWTNSSEPDLNDFAYRDFLEIDPWCPAEPAEGLNAGLG